MLSQRPPSVRTERLLEALKDLDVRFAYIGTSTVHRPGEPRTLLALQNAFVHRIHPYFAIKEAIEARSRRRQPRDCAQ